MKIVLFFLLTRFSFGDGVRVFPEVTGGTPEVLGYNMSHFQAGTNAAAWWRYSGVNGARVFLSPKNVEPEDDMKPWGDGVDSESTFMARRAAMRADPHRARPRADRAH